MKTTLVQLPIADVFSAAKCTCASETLQQLRAKVVASRVKQLGLTAKRTRRTRRSVQAH